jgi:hypothetical protein
MKKFKVTITAELELPDDFELADDPREKLLCLKQGSRHYHPMIQWMHQKPSWHAVGILSNFEGPPSLHWEAVDDDTADKLFDASIRNGVWTEAYRLELL